LLAFTLVELLVVVAIVSILGLLTIAGAQRVLSAGNSAKCVANLRQIGVLMHSYFADHGGWAPPHSGWAFNEPPGVQPQTSIGWAGRLAPYIDENASYNAPISSLFTCPSDPDRKSWPKVRSYLNQGISGIPESANTSSKISYGYNYVTFTTAWGMSTSPYFPQGNVRRVTTPASVILVADSMPASKGGLNPSLVFWFNPRVWPDTRHRGSFNAVFVDGHVQWVPYADATSKVSPTGIPYWSHDGFIWTDP